MVLDDKLLHEYLVNAEAPHGPILGSTLFLLYINNLLEDFVYDILLKRSPRKSEP